jgi:hypothetical protein
MVVEDMQDRLFMVGFGRRRKEHKSLWWHGSYLVSLDGDK